MDGITMSVAKKWRMNDTVILPLTRICPVAAAAGRCCVTSRRRLVRNDENRSDTSSSDSWAGFRRERTAAKKNIATPEWVVENSTLSPGRLIGG
jgi:hypothetical protein